MDSTDSTTYIYIATLVDSTKDGDIHIGIWSEDKKYCVSELLHAGNDAYSAPNEVELYAVNRVLDMDLATKDIRIVTTCTLTALRVTRAVVAAKSNRKVNGSSKIRCTLRSIVDKIVQYADDGKNITIDKDKHSTVDSLGRNGISMACGMLLTLE